jgi:soluble lytic murein transglycosylase-like protein
MPSTANTVLKTDRFTREPTALFEPQLNMSIGQLYLEKLMNLGAVRGDLFRTLAAYNAGPRPVLEAVRSLGNDTDALLMMESIPVAQTRVYVEHVVANYWIYRHSQGLDSPSLSAAANDANLVLISADKG